MLEPFSAGPLPKFEGLGGPPIAPLGTGPTGSPPQAVGPIRVPPLTPEKISEYSSLFEKSGAQNGILAGMGTVAHKLVKLLAPS